tara:strand:+ start:2825 stop:2998 length:174 start_codon:yes stop_codon:yes gene_type:complete
MSFPFLILAGISILILAGDIQTNATTSQIPLFLYLIWALAGTLFLFAVLRAVRLMGR